jgi:ribosomal protein L32
MLVEMIPECPRLHHGVMAVDQDAEYGVEFVCRLCGTRIYPNKPETISGIEVASEAGRPRKLPKYSGKEQLPNICEKCGNPHERRRFGRICKSCKRKEE